jgi:hypothetical protein
VLKYYHDRLSRSPTVVSPAPCRSHVANRARRSLSSSPDLAMPHATRDSSATRVPYRFPSDGKMVGRSSMEKFPDMDLPDPQGLGLHSNNLTQQNEYLFPPAGERWQPRRDTESPSPSWWQTASAGPRGHSRQKSLTDAFRTIRSRKGSVNANIHEISDALKAPVSPKLIVRIRGLHVAIRLMLINLRFSV